VRRPEIIAAARELFASKGYEATSVEDVASVVGVTKPVIYASFSSKLALYTEVFDQEQQAMMDRFIADVGDSLDPNKPLQTVRGTLSAVLHRVAESPASHQFLFTGHYGVPFEVSQRHEEIMTERVDFIANYFSPLFSDLAEPIARDTAFVFAVSLVLTIRTAARVLLEEPDRWSPDYLADLFARSAVEGVEGLKAGPAS